MKNKMDDVQVEHRLNLKAGECSGRSLVMNFEIFPDELILDIFEYFDIRDLYQSFYDLNCRFDHLVQSKSTYALTTCSADEMEDPLLDQFAKQITKLVVDHSSYIDFHLFPSLTVLILNCPSEDQLEQIYLCSFPHLLHLEFGIMASTLSHRSLHRFFHSKQFPFLESCIFHHDDNPVSLNRYRQLWANPSILRTLWFHSVDLSLGSEIHRHRHLHTHDPNDAIKMKVLHTHLKRLDLCCGPTGPTIHDIDQFLIQAPNVERLRIASHEVYYSFEFLDQLASIFYQRLLGLKQFDCELFCLISLEDMQTIVHLHPCFQRIQCQSKYGGQYIRLFTA